jgi:hypothetical protein
VKLAVLHLHLAQMVRMVQALLITSTKKWVVKIAVEVFTQLKKYLMFV